jgi:hypothetical protein
MKPPKALADAIAEGMGPMSSQEFRETIAKLGMSQLGCGRFLEVDGRTIRRLASILNNDEIPPAYAMLLRVMALLELEPNDVRRLIGRGAIPRDELSRAAGNPNWSTSE